MCIIQPRLKLFNATNYSILYIPEEANTPMKRFNQYLLLFFLSLFIGVLAPAAIAAGKIENVSEEDVRRALKDSIKAAEDALAALKSGAEEAVVSEHINNARQWIKRVENNRLDVIRTRSAESLKKARQAVAKGDAKQAEESLLHALKGFKEMQSSL